MTRKARAPSRDIYLRRIVIAAAMLLVAIVGGALLGRVAVGGDLRAGAGGEPDFASLSANPDALVADPVAPLDPCIGCADSYGVAARMRAADGQDDDAFRALGAVREAAYAPPDSAGPADDYRYGGRFPDPPAAATPGARPGAVRTPEPAALPVQAEDAGISRAPGEEPQ